MRIAAPVAGGAAVISLLVGLMVGVPFGTALVRALLSAIVGGGLALAVSIVARAQLPGIDRPPDAASKGSQVSEGESDSPHEPASGSRLNIVVEDDGDSDSSEAVQDGDDSETERHDAVRKSEAEARGSEPESSELDASEFDASEDASQAESSAPPSRAAETARAPGATSPDNDEDDEQEADLVEEVEESTAEDEEAVMHAAISEEQDGSSMEIDDSMLDEMPDIGKYSSSFVSGGDTESDGDETTGGSGQSSGPSGGSKQKAGDPRKGFDDKTVAKALQTLLAKDDE